MVAAGPIAMQFYLVQTDSGLGADLQERDGP